MLNQEKYPEYIDISNYQATFKVLMKQLESQEQLLIEIRDTLVKQKPKKIKQR